MHVPSKNISGNQIQLPSQIERSSSDSNPVRTAMSSYTPSTSDSSGNGRQPSQQHPPSRYESQKRRDWNTFGQYLKNHRPPLALSRCSGAHVLEFLRYLDQFGKTKVHTSGCPFFGQPHPPAPCPCPLRQAWGSLDALIGRLRAAFEENGGQPEANPFGARAVRLYLREVRDVQSKARGIAYEKKKRKKNPQQHQPVQQPQSQLQQQQQQQQQQQVETVQPEGLGLGCQVLHGHVVFGGGSGGGGRNNINMGLFGGSGGGDEDHQRFLLFQPGSLG